MTHRRPAAAVLVIALSGCGSHAPPTATRGTSGPPTAKQSASNPKRGCNDSSTLRAFAGERRLAPQVRAAVLQVAALVELHPVHGLNLCGSSETLLLLKSKGPATHRIRIPDDLCLQALGSLGLLARLPTELSSRDTKRAARHAYRVVMHYEQRGQTLCVAPAAPSH
jgi:hypothetical protein